MTSTNKIWKELTTILSNPSNFHSLEAVDRVSEKQLQVGENSNWIIWRLKGQSCRFLMPDMHVQNKKYVNFVSIFRLTGKCATQKLKNLRSSSLWTSYYVVLRSQNKNTDFLMILAWLCRFTHIKNRRWSKSVVTLSVRVKKIRPHFKYLILTRGFMKDNMIWKFRKKIYYLDSH